MRKIKSLALTSIVVSPFTEYYSDTTAQIEMDGVIVLRTFTSFPRAALKQNLLTSTLN